MKDRKQALDRDGDRRGIQSVEIGLRLIDVLSEEAGPMSLKALAGAAGLPISNCHRYCVSFVRAGYMVQDARSGHYNLGPRLIHAGLATLGRSDAVSVATSALEALVDETGHTGQLAIWGERGPTIIRWIAGRAAVRTSMSVGATLPLLTSATGRVFLGFLPRRQTATMAVREAVAGGGDPDLLAADAVARCMGHVAGDHIPGLSAIAAPVRDAFGEAAAVIALIGTSSGFGDGVLDKLQNAASIASGKLGWLPSAEIMIKGDCDD